MTWWWLSFADGGLPKGSQFLGAAIVEGDNVSAAIQSAWDQGINPGGEVMAFEWEPETGVEFPFGPELCNRLLSLEEIVEHDIGERMPA